MTARDYNAESTAPPGRKYSYNFDGYMRHYAWRVFSGHCVPGSVLEVGAHDGQFTEIFIENFSDVSVLEPASIMQKVLDDKFPDIRMYDDTLQDFVTQRKYDNIFMANVLEHIDDRVNALKKAGSILSDAGRLFIMVPNADAGSRKIARRMGLMVRETDVLPHERKIGHFHTYSRASFNQDIAAAGLKIVEGGGIFFKALCNSQFDEALDAGIIDKKYMDACFDLGFECPDFCASLYAICEKEDAR